MRDLIFLMFVLAATVCVLRYGKPFVAALKRFDARNIARREEEYRSRYDGYWHYRQTLKVTEEQVEPVTAIERPDARTGVMTRVFLFDAREFATLADAEAARQEAVVGKARDFYSELDGNRLQSRSSYPIPPRALPKPNGKDP